MQSFIKFTVAVVLCAAAVLGNPAITSTAHAAPIYATLDNFPATNPGGLEGSDGPLVADQSGALYGTLVSGGTTLTGSVFKLTRPAAGQSGWAMQTLWSFTNGADGGYPEAGVTLDASTGILYGVTTHGGANGSGTLFKLVPPGAGQANWTETTLYSFPTGYLPGSSGLTLDAAGRLYGTTESGGSFNRGTAFMLSPPRRTATAWTYTTLWSFGGTATDGYEPLAGVAIDANGALYASTLFGGNTGCPDGFGGTTTCGTVVKLNPPAAGLTAWTESLLYAFSGPSDGFAPSGGLTVDAIGTVYGTTNKGGAGVCASSYNGVLYNLGCGTVFKVAPAVAGQSAPVHTILHSFTNYPNDGATPYGALVNDQAGSLYGTTFAGGTQYGGTVYKLEPPAPGQTQWSQSILADLAYQAGGFPLAGPSAHRGVLYGTTSAGGTLTGGTAFDVLGVGWNAYPAGSIVGPPVPATNPVCISTVVSQPTLTHVAVVTFTNNCSYDVAFYGCEAQAVNPRGNLCGSPPRNYDLQYVLPAQATRIDEQGVAFTGGIEYAGVKECPENYVFPGGLITSLICVRP